MYLIHCGHSFLTKRSWGLQRFKTSPPLSVFLFPFFPFPLSSFLFSFPLSLFRPFSFSFSSPSLNLSPQPWVHRPGSGENQPEKGPDLPGGLSTAVVRAIKPSWKADTLKNLTSKLRSSGWKARLTQISIEPYTFSLATTSPGFSNCSL